MPGEINKDIKKSISIWHKGQGFTVQKQTTPLSSGALRFQEKEPLRNALGGGGGQGDAGGARGSHDSKLTGSRPPSGWEELTALFGRRHPRTQRWPCPPLQTAGTCSKGLLRTHGFFLGGNV